MQKVTLVLLGLPVIAVKAVLLASQDLQGQPVALVCKVKEVTRDRKVPSVRLVSPVLLVNLDQSAKLDTRVNKDYQVAREHLDLPEQLEQMVRLI